MHATTCPHQRPISRPCALCRAAARAHLRAAAAALLSHAAPDLDTVRAAAPELLSALLEVTTLLAGFRESIDDDPDETAIIGPALDREGG